MRQWGLEKLTSKHKRVLSFSCAEADSPLINSIFKGENESELQQKKGNKDAAITLPSVRSLFESSSLELYWSSLIQREMENLSIAKE